MYINIKYILHTNEDKASENKVLPIRELNKTFKMDADKILLSTIMILIKNAVERFIKRKKINNIC